MYLANQPTACYMRASFPGSSVVEQLTVNQLVAGSNPARGAIFSLYSIPLFLFEEHNENARLKPVAQVKLLSLSYVWKYPACKMVDDGGIEPAKRALARLPQRCGGFVN